MLLKGPEFLSAGNGLETARGSLEVKSTNETFQVTNRWTKQSINPSIQPISRHSAKRWFSE